MYQSEPLEFPYCPNQFFGLLTIQQTGSRNFSPFDQSEDMADESIKISDQMKSWQSPY